MRCCEKIVMKRRIEIFLALLAAANCTITPLMFAASLSQPMWPLPGLYFLEIALLGIAGAWIALAEQPTGPGWGLIPWIAAGVLSVFVVLGAFTIGLFLIPAALFFLVAGFLSRLRFHLPLSTGLGVFLLSVIFQAALMIGILSFAL